MHVFKSGTSVQINKCQICSSDKLELILDLGYLPPVNNFYNLKHTFKEENFYPTQLLKCAVCELVQLSTVVDSEILFPKEYPYTSSTTKILRENFKDLYIDCNQLCDFKSKDLIIDIGSNDGNLLSNFKSHKVLGVTPEEIGKIAIERGIPTIIDYFTKNVASQIIKDHGKAVCVTATNVFAHIEDPKSVMENILNILDEKGIFATECHYLDSLIETLQYDTIYHEHLRYYSLRSLKYLFDSFDLEIIFAKKIPTHGGSIRVLVSRKGNYKINSNVKNILDLEKENINKKILDNFSLRVRDNKIHLLNLITNLKKNNKTIFGVSAPSRSSTLINYCGIDESMIENILEIEGSYKIGKFLPGTKIPVINEKILLENQPDYLLLFSWHIKDDLIYILRKKGFNGKFIVPLPIPEIL